MGDSQEMDEDLSEEQIIATILDLGNQIWGNMGQEIPIQDPTIFFRDQFYIQFFESAFPDNDFSQLVETDDEDEMAGNIQALIDMLSQNILMYDLEHIKGDQIVGGNPEHCINLLQLAKEISCMMNQNSNELDSRQMQGEGDEEEDDGAEEDEGGLEGQVLDDEELGDEDADSEQQKLQLLAMQQQLDLDDQDGDEMDEHGMPREGGSSSSDKQSDEGDEDQHQDSQGVVHYDQIDVELDEDEDNEGQEEVHEGMDIEDDDEMEQYQDDSNDVEDGDNEVSINLEDAIATAEEINKRGDLQFTHDQHRGGGQESDEDEDAMSPYGEEQEDLTSAQEIAGIVTDGHNEKDGFDQMREEQLHRQRMVRAAHEYGDEEDSGVYDEEDDIRDHHELDQDPRMNQGDRQTEDDRHGHGDDVDEDEDDDQDEEVEDNMHMQIHPDLIAAAHKMGVELDSEQIQELRQFIQDQNIDLDEAGQSDDEDAGGQDGDINDPQEQRRSESAGSPEHHLKQSSGKRSQKPSDKAPENRSAEPVDDDDEENDNSSQDEQAYQYLQQEQQFHQQEADEDEDGDQMDEDVMAQNEQPEDQDGEADSQAEGEEDDEDKVQFDVDELNDQERQLLVAYLQEEYEKNPDSFHVPKEKLSELLNAQLNRQNQDGESFSKLENIEEGYAQEDGEDGDEDGQEFIAEQSQLTEEQQKQLLMMQQQQEQDIDEEGEAMDDDDQQDDQELEIEGGGQEIDAEDYPTEYELNDQQLSEEQLQQVMLMQQQQQQMAMQQDRMGMQESTGDEMIEDGTNLHEMQQIYGKKQTKTGKRKATKSAASAHMMVPNSAQAAQSVSKYAQARGKKGFTAQKQMLGGTQESTGDTNPLQRLMQAPPRTRPATGKTDNNTGKKATRLQRPSTAKPRQPAQSYKQFIASQSNRNAGRTQRNTQQASTQSQQIMRPARKQSARKRTGNAAVKKGQLNTISHMPQQEDQQQQMLQQLMAQKQEGGIMPMFDEDFLNQLSEEQLQQVIQQQQAVIQQQPPTAVSKSGQLLPPKPNKRSRSAKRPQSSGVLTDAASSQHGHNQRASAKTRAQIYNQNMPTISSGRRKTSKGSSQGREKKASKGKRRKAQPGQGILLNNFFPALESGGPHHHSGQKGANQSAEEQFAAQQAALLAAQDQQNQEQIINEVPPEEEEGESQDIVNSRIQQTNTTMQAQQDQVQQMQQQQHNMQLLQMLERLPPEQQQEFLEQLSHEQQEQLLIQQQQMQEQAEGGNDNQQMVMFDENGQPIQGQFVDANQAETVMTGNASPDAGGAELTEEQLVELLKNADQLSLEQQQQLQSILKSRWKKEMKSQKQKQYSNIYNILTENVAKAKVRLAKLADSPSKKSSKQNENDKETMDRISRQKKEYETLLKQYSHEQKARHRGREAEQRRIEKQIAREMRLKQIREKKFEEELINQQKSLMYKRNAQQVRLCQKVYQLASNLEKNKLLEEKRQFLENQNLKRTQKKLMVDGIENFYRDKINMLRERIETEKFERKIAQMAQVEALSRMKRELDLSKKKEIEKYLHLLKQEDQKYDFQSSNLHKLESEIVRLYKK